MSDNYVEYSSKCNSLKPEADEDESKIPNFKLLYRNTKNPERDKSSGVSSDDETTSSSLVPIPNTLSQMRCELRKTTIDPRERSEAESPIIRNGLLEKPTGKVMQTLEEFRKKYTLLNENSVTWKMNSANLMLDDILHCTNFDKTLNENCKEQTKLAVETETESLNTEVTCAVNGCGHFPLIHTHTMSPINYSSPCHIHNKVFQSTSQYYNSLEKELSPQKMNEKSQKGKSLGEKIQNLKGIKAVYQTFVKTKNPFTKTNHIDSHLGIHGANHKSDGSLKKEPNTCQCKVKTHYPKKMIFDLVESSDNTNSDIKSMEREELKCTCNKLRCTCPEVIPKCVCADYACQVIDQSENPQMENSQVRNTCENYDQSDEKNASIMKQKNEEEYNLLTEKENHINRGKKSSLQKSNPELKKFCSKERKYIERTDIYYFDHGNSAYYQTTDNHPLRYTECLVERTDEYAKKFWAEIFGFFGIGVAFLISFILQLYRFLFASVIRSLIVGLLQIFSDYFFKPLLTVLFNGLIQPCLILAYNVATSFRDLCLPVSQIFGFFAKEVANIFRACRIVEVNHDRPACTCGNKV